MKSPAAASINVGILSPDTETRRLLRSQVQATGIARIQVEVDSYCIDRADRATRLFQDANPDIIVVDLEQSEAAMQSLQILNAALPKTWLFVVSSDDSPKAIIESMRLGAREFLHKNSLPDLAAALRRFLDDKKRLQEVRAPSGKIYSVMTAKGGSGATSVAINLAASISGFPTSRVGLIDLNMSTGDAATYLNLSPQFTLTDVLENLARIDPMLLETYMSSANGISVLTGPRDYRPGQTIPVEAAVRILDVASRAFTHVVADIPHWSEEELKQITEISTKILVVLTPEVPALWRTTRLLQVLETAGAAEKLQVVLNRSQKSDGISEKEIEKVLKFPLHWKLPNNYSAAIKAINSGRPLVEFNHSELASSYKEFASHLSGIPLPDKRRKIFGLFS
jgi:pilus assembly protein CpaE